MAAVRKIFTARDARDTRHQSEAKREHRLAVRQARAKVKRWEGKVAQFGGDVQNATLARMRGRLVELES
jgi:hypothetical protein